jgi:hypothetical protein
MPKCYIFFLEFLARIPSTLAITQLIPYARVSANNLNSMLKTHDQELNWDQRMTRRNSTDNAASGTHMCPICVLGVFHSFLFYLACLFGIFQKDSYGKFENSS